MKLSILIFFTFLSFGVIAQSISVKKGDKVILVNADKSEACNQEMVFMIVEQMPNYKGGTEILEKKLNELIKVDTKLKGEINIWTTINCEGKAFGFQIVKFLDGELEEKIIRELVKLQNWEAGKQRNKNVDTIKNIRLNIRKGKITIIN